MPRTGASGSGAPCAGDRRGAQRSRQIRPMAIPGSSSVPIKRKSQATMLLLQNALIRRICKRKASSSRSRSFAPASQGEVSISGRKGNEKPNNASGSACSGRLMKRTNGSVFTTVASFNSDNTNALLWLVPLSRWQNFTGIQSQLFHGDPNSFVSNVFQQCDVIHLEVVQLIGA